MTQRLCTLCSRVALLVFVTCAQSLIGDDFSADLQFLSEQNVQEVGRDAKAAGYQKLLNDYPDHPKRLTMMLELSSLWEISIPDAGILPDYGKSIQWLETAVQLAAEGSEYWVRAQFLLASRLFEQDPETSQAILREIRRLATDPMTEIKALYELQMTEVRIGRLDIAEEFCMQIQSAADDPSRLPENLYDKGKIFSVQQASAASMMEAWLYSGGTREERLQKLKNIVELRPTQFNQDLLGRMQVRLDGMKEIQPSRSPASGKPARDGASRYRWVIVANVIVLLVFVGIVFYHRKRQTG